MPNRRLRDDLPKKHSVNRYDYESKRQTNQVNRGDEALRFVGIASY